MSATEPEEKAYVAICQHCKRLVGAMTPTCPDRAKQVASWMRDGLDIQRFTADQVRQGDWGHVEPCPFHRKATKSKSASEA